MSDWYSRAREEDGRTDDEVLDDIFVCDWGAKPDEKGECPYCAGEMCARIDNLACLHSRRERHG